ncbi:MAG: peptidoglycan DD-metalloendopeptidase family protein [Chitinispirillia bacterium]|jgi:murein DD-endopeptidase MepM/ murein hydrolase activator NlpD
MLKLMVNSRFLFVLIIAVFVNVSAAETKSSGTAVIKSLMDTMFADGFHFPVGKKDSQNTYMENPDNNRDNGWNCSVKFGQIYKGDNRINPGEDWNYYSGGNTGPSQPVFATARGVVMFSGIGPSHLGKVILIRHIFLRNNIIDTVFSLYAHLDTILVKKDDFILGRIPIGSIDLDPDKTIKANLHFEIRKNSLKDYPVDFRPGNKGKDRVWTREHYNPPTSFIKEHKTLTVPAFEKHMLIAVKHRYKMYYLRRGKKYTIYEIALSQNPMGHKVMQGDNRLPEGAYRIIQKARGPFGGAYGKYFGPVWIRINYPNNFDAKIAFQNSLISRSDYDRIVNANNSGKWPPKNTKLGGGIGLHGWNGQWDIKGNRHLTWGCISMQNGDIESLYGHIPVGTKILILP